MILKKGSRSKRSAERRQYENVTGRLFNQVSLQIICCKPIQVTPYCGYRRDKEISARAASTPGNIGEGARDSQNNHSSIEHIKPCCIANGNRWAWCDGPFFLGWDTG